MDECDTADQRIEESISDGINEASRAVASALAYALSLWVDWMRNDFAEIRPLWYPSRSLSLECRQSVTEDTASEHENEIEHRIAIEVNNGVINLTPAQRAALERSLGLCAVVRVRDYEVQLEEAHVRVWRHILAMGCI